MGELGEEKDGGVGAREFVADNRDLGAAPLRFEIGTGSIMEGVPDLGFLSELLSEMLCLSRGFLPFRMSFNLSGSSSKST